MKENVELIGYIERFVKKMDTDKYDERINKEIFNVFRDIINEFQEYYKLNCKEALKLGLNVNEMLNELTNMFIGVYMDTLKGLSLGTQEITKLTSKGETIN